MPPILAGRTAATVTPAGAAFTVQGIDDPTCGTSSSKLQGQSLSAVSNNAAGPPATTGVPLRISDALRR